MSKITNKKIKNMIAAISSRLNNHIVRDDGDNVNEFCVKNATTYSVFKIRQIVAEIAPGEFNVTESFDVDTYEPLVYVNLITSK